MFVYWVGNRRSDVSVCGDKPVGLRLKTKGDTTREPTLIWP